MTRTHIFALAIIIPLLIAFIAMTMKPRVTVFSNPDFSKLNANCTKWSIEADGEYPIVPGEKYNMYLVCVEEKE